MSCVSPAQDVLEVQRLDAEIAQLKMVCLRCAFSRIGQ